MQQFLTGSLEELEIIVKFMDDTAEMTRDERRALRQII